MEREQSEHKKTAQRDKALTLVVGCKRVSVYKVAIRFGCLFQIFEPLFLSFVMSHAVEQQQRVVGNS